MAISALKEAKGHYDAHMQLSNGARQDLAWWILNVERSRRPISHGNPTLILQSDACNSGWGGNPRGGMKSETGGHWSHEESTLHINEKELLAAMFTLQSYCKNIEHAHVQLQVDNTTAAAYINKQGGKKPKCNHIARTMWAWAIERNLHLSASFLPGALNTTADAASRRFHDNMEWQLQHIVFQPLTAIWGEPDIDLFASRLNHQVPKFAAWQPEPDAFAIDAFSFSWEEGLCYIFPPFCLLGRILRKLAEDKAEAIIIAPLWTTQSWFTSLLALLIDCVFVLPRGQLISHSSHHQDPPAKLQLLACRVSGRNCKAFHSNLGYRRSSCRHTDNQPRSNMTLISTSGVRLRRGGVSIPSHRLLQPL